MTVVVNLGHIADVVSGVGFPKEMQGNAEGEVPVFKVGDISIALKNGTRHLRRSPNHLCKEAAKRLSKNLMPAGTTIFAKIGEGLKLNRRGILAQPSLVDNNVMGLIPKAGVVSPDYLYYFMKTVDLGELSQATAIPSVRKSDVVEIRIPLRALSDQEIIVAEIEKQFSRLDEAVAGLKRVKANLKRYKAAILKAAVEGRLVPTEAELARREGRNYETGAQLLQRILDTRRSQWQGKGKYKEPAAPDTSDLPELPEGWAWASPEQLSAGQPYSLAIGPFGSSLKVSDYTTAGVPLVFVRNIRSVLFGGSNTAFISPKKADELKAHWVESGDLLITKMGAPPGDVCVYPANNPTAVITADCIKLRLVHGLLSVQFFADAIESKLVNRQILGITKGVAQLKVSLGRFSTIAFPVPPLAEQHRIVAEVDRLLSIAREAETEVETNLKRAANLRQSVLGRAFSA